MPSNNDQLKPDECVHAHPVPPSEISRYSPTRDPATEQEIGRYVEIEAGDEVVEHVEKVKEEFVLGEKYEIWDVATDKGRWWVLTNLTNLYSQKHFPSLDYTLSFHIGLMMRLRSRQSDNGREESDPFDEVERRQQQARDRHERAIEAEDFQSIGLQLRECLLCLVAAMRRRVNPRLEAPFPKEADFVSWYEIMIAELCSGGSNKQLRQYMKLLGRETWQLVNWLTHHRNANSVTSSIAIHSCDTLIGHTVQLIVRQAANNVDTCPKCQSRNIRTHFDHLIEPDGEYFSTCGACNWSNHPSN